jgi:hypothetical protein
MSDNSYKLRALQNICEAILRNEFDLVVTQLKEPISPWHCNSKTSYSIQSVNNQLSFEAIARSALTLIEERHALWLLSEEGQVAQKKSLATAMWLGAINPDFTLDAAKQDANEQFQPFDAVIKILEQNGYEVTKK